MGDSGDEFVTEESFRDVNVTLNFTPLFASIGAYLRTGSSGSSAGRLCNGGDRLYLSILGWVSGELETVPPTYFWTTVIEVDHVHDRSNSRTPE
jgi:hypothetical protein